MAHGAYEMKSFIWKVVGCCAIALGVCAPASAQISYISVTGTNTKISGAGFDENGFGARFGAQLFKNFAIELGYDRLGSTDFRIDNMSFPVKLDGISVALVGRYELVPNLYVRGSLGRIRVRQKVSGFASDEQPEDASRAIFGFGVEQSFHKNFSIFGELRQAKFDDVRLRQLNAGLKINF